MHVPDTPSAQPAEHRLTARMAGQPRDLCTNVFDVVAEKNQTVSRNHTIVRCFNSFSDTQDRLQLALYCAAERVRFTTDAVLLGELEIDLRKHNGGTHREVEVTFVLGGPEITVKARFPGESAEVTHYVSYLHD